MFTNSEEVVLTDSDKYILFLVQGREEPCPTSVLDLTNTHFHYFTISKSVPKIFPSTTPPHLGAHTQQRVASSPVQPTQVSQVGQVRDGQYKDYTTVPSNSFIPSHLYWTGSDSFMVGCGMGVFEECLCKGRGGVSG